MFRSNKLLKSSFLKRAAMLSVAVPMQYTLTQEATDPTANTDAVPKMKRMGGPSCPSTARPMIQGKHKFVVELNNKAVSAAAILPASGRTITHNRALVSRRDGFFVTATTAAAFEFAAAATTSVPAAAELLSLATSAIVADDGEEGGNIPLRRGVLLQFWVVYCCNFANVRVICCCSRPR
jgi:hypothetical protein